MISDTLKQRAQAFDYLFDAVVVTDMKGIIADWNKGSEALYGYSKAEAIGQPVHILHVPEDSEHITAEVIAAVEKEGTWTGEVRMLHKNGNIGWVESICVPIYDSTNQMIGALGINRNITQRVNETKRLEHLAHYDFLTKIPNRYLLLARLEHLIAQSERNSHSFALFYIDLDKFKIINDTEGHAFGDKVLLETAQRLKRAIRNADTVARIGGDEFVLLLENIASEKVISSMISTLSQKLSQIYTINNKPFEVNYSIGVAIYPGDGTTPDTLLAHADKAMYKCKKQHKEIDC